ncbi:MAG: hypothetical protein IPP51_17710 [Bacteroidetes bacterium]|nr:hypothetical protein [Bacteroidota bacterium]
MKIQAFLFFAATILFNSCDPGLNGDLKVFNNTSVNLNLVTYDFDSSDTLTYLLHPNANVTVKVLGGLGNQKHLIVVRVS